MAPGESVEKVAFGVLRICDKINPRMSDEEKVRYLIDALPKKYHIPLMRADYKDWNAALERIREVDRISRESERIEERQRMVGQRKESGLKNSEERKETLRDSLPKENEKKREAEAIPVMQVQDGGNSSTSEQREKFPRPRGGSAPRGKGKGQGTEKKEVDKRKGKQKKGDIDLSVIKVWRTQEGYPICYDCGKAGHISKNCTEKKDPSVTDKKDLKEGVKPVKEV